MAMQRDGAVDILTIDYEDWFHILDPGWTDPRKWRDLPLSIENDVGELLALLDRHGAKATFFVVGWLAERTPALVREIARRGHTLASHGYHHVPPKTMAEEEFRDDLGRSIAVLEVLGGKPVRGFRAPGFGVRDCPFPYREILRECGIAYDASRFPGVFPGRSVPGASPWPARSARGDPRKALWDVPVSTVEVLGARVAFSGGGFLRVLPNWVVQACADQVRRQGRPVVTYLHPRDLNPRSPQIPTNPWNRLRYYGGRRGVKRKVAGLLGRRRFVSVEEYLDLAAN